MIFNPNDPATWATKELHRPPVFDAVGFQERIDEIFGLSDTGLPVVRLVWAADIERTYSKFYTSWVGLAGAGSELRAKYKYSTIMIEGTPDIIDIPPPRWMIEQYEHPGQIGESYEAARWSKDGRELRPPLDERNSYSHLFTIASHYKKCCRTAKMDKVICWGKYREPAERDLDRLRTAKARRDADYEIDTTKPLSEVDQMRLALETKQRIADQEELTQRKIREFVDENALELIGQVVPGARISEKNRKFSLPKFSNNKTTEAGIIIPSSD